MSPADDRAASAGAARAGPRVAITGIGLVTSLGVEREATWLALREGRVGARVLDLPVGRGEPPYAGYPAPMPEVDPEFRAAWRLDRAWEMLCRAASGATRDAGLTPTLGRHVDPGRVAAVIGSSKGGLGHLGAWRHAILAGGRPPSPLDWTESWPHAPGWLLGDTVGAAGPRIAPVAACATGVVAVLRAARLIRRGECDVALAGASDAQHDPLPLAAFRRMGVLARVDGDPASAVRPCDRRRTGFLPGEGAAVLVLERADHARARGVSPYAEVAGGALGSDATHVTGLDPDPANLAALVLRALDDAGMAPGEIDHVNLHGTATRDNDPLECRALRRAFGPDADALACSASKAQVGHLLGAAGAAELAIACLAIRDGFVPPTLNLTEPDPACDLDLTPLVGRPRPLRAALKLSLGFGGHLAAAVLLRPDGPRRPPPPPRVDPAAASSG